MLPKRIWAMMGVVYMLLLVLLMVYWMATMRLIEGITGLMLAPAFAALSAQAFNRRWIIRHGREGHVEEKDFTEPPFPQPGGQRELLLGLGCAALTLVTLVLGVLELSAYFAAA